MQKTSERPTITVGYKVGKLKVDAPTEQRKNGYTVWRCKCKCGNEILLDTRTLQRRTVKDCGCETKTTPKQRNLKDVRFGSLVCREPTERRNSNGSVIWRCDCDCGNTCYVAAKDLLSENTKSCGCLAHPPLKDYIGRHFDQLEVIEYAGKRAGMHYWKCLCECRNTTVVGQTSLQSRKTKSCGCLQKTQIIQNLKLCDGTSVAILEASKRKLTKSNKSGYTGVYQKSNGRWCAQITFKRKTYYLGVFDDIQDAVRARKRGEEMHDDFLEWYYEQHPDKQRDESEGQHH